MSTIEHPVVSELIWLDPERLVPDPDNPRGELRDIESLAETMKNGVGVLEPITFREVQIDGGVPTFVIVRGHRRQAAAILAGIGAVPCVPEGINESERQRASKRMIENLARDDFSAAEEARGVQQLLDLGMDVAEISSALALSGERVTAAARISKSAVATAVAEKHDLSLEHAIAIAEFDEDREAVKLLTVAALEEPGQFPHLLERLRTKRKREEAMAEAVAKWEAQGYRILTNQERYLGGRTLVPLSWLKVGAGKDAKNLTKTTHKRCPGRAVFFSVSWNNKIDAEECCLDPVANGHVNIMSTRSSSSGASAAPKVSDAEAARLTQERRIHRACINAGRAAQTVRHQFVRGLLQRKTAPKGMLRFAVEEALSGRVDDQVRMFCDLTGEPVPKETYMGAGPAQRRYLARLNEAQTPLALFARIAADIEADWEPNTWNTTLESSLRRRKGYLAILIASGYVPSTVEKAGVLGGDPAAVLAEAEGEKLAAKAVGVTRSPVEPVAKRRAPTKPAAVKKAGRKTLVATRPPVKSPTEPA